MKTREQLPLAGGTGLASSVTGLSGTTLRRLAKRDPSFPQPFLLGGRRDFRWPLPALVEWLEDKAGRRLSPRTGPAPLPGGAGR